jgi:P-type E1-E2 ATPase
VFVIRGRGEGGSGSNWIAAVFLAPGDLILLSEGETVPADIRLLRVHEFRVDEAVLTGDPRPVAKATDWTGGAGAPTDIPDLCFSGTQVVAGTATGMVVATGSRTLAAMLKAS